MKEYLTFDDVNIKPQYSEVESRSGIKLDCQFTTNWKLKTPLVSAPMETVTGVEMACKMMHHGGCGILHRFDNIEDQAQMVRDVYDWRQSGNDGNNNWGPIAAAIGVTGDWKLRADKLVCAGADILLLDVAHGYHKLVAEAIEYLIKEYPQNGSLQPGGVDVIAGNVSTVEGCIFLQEAGADAIRFGQGNGSLCETRIRTGIGIPQVSGLLESVYEVDIPIIADGGIRQIGDCAKALGTGANTVMLGSLLAGTTETPFPIERHGQWPNEVLVKKYRGAASLESKMARGESKNVEGNSKVIPYKGHASRIINDIEDGIRSSCSYVGAHNLSQFATNVEFVRVTPAGTAEAQPHLLT